MLTRRLRARGATPFEDRALEIDTIELNAADVES